MPCVGEDVCSFASGKCSESWRELETDQGVCAVGNFAIYVQYLEAEAFSLRLPFVRDVEHSV